MCSEALKRLTSNDNCARIGDRRLGDKDTEKLTDRQADRDVNEEFHGKHLLSKSRTKVKPL